jgi:hypothetical protein
VVTPSLLLKHSRPIIVVDDNHNDSAKAVLYPQHSSTKSTVEVHSDAIPENITKAIYEVTKCSSLPWGTYVTVEEALEYSSSQPNSYLPEDFDLKDPAARKQELATAAVYNFLFKSSADNTHHVQKVTSSDSPDCLRSEIQSMIKREKDGVTSSSEQIMHGVGVWALSSDANSSVPYHMDYAEFIRYEHNIIVPPLFAGTLHCTPPPHSVQGGEFAVNRKGWKHYDINGYKGLKQGNDKMTGWSRPQNLGSKQTEIHSDDESGWITIPYKFNQGTLFTGNLPHLSGPVTGFERETQKLSTNDTRRVILGFNVFSDDVGHVVQKVPEHSDTFRQRVRWRQAMLSKSNQNEVHGLTMASVRKNSALRKMLILAKREKVKEEWKRRQLKMTEWVFHTLLDDKKIQGERGRSLTVEQLISLWSQEEHEIEGYSLDMLPSETDLHVHIHRLLIDGHIFNSKEDRFATKTSYKLILFEAYPAKEVRQEPTGRLITPQSSVGVRKMPIE